ncbi:HK97-gp10 family putative phage morphogenesis protein [Marinobacter shengliensis]|uniref:HK97-gp10 family putative phage morphogenesis protein n=1 Tax=Marinobacter shengliensis TaxID=1389223 RepID=UPI001107F5A5|nr:HK97-gp10 family putative phage morphogenesis protein [Marinobacter shengliensis]
MARDGIEYNMTGMPELLGKLEGLEYDLKRKGGRFALRKAAQVIRDQARANAERVDDPRTSENIAANIVERWSGRLFKRTGNLGFRVGVLGGAKGAAEAAGEVAGKGSGNPGGDTFYWRFVEFGTENAPAHPFMRPAINQVANEPVDVFIKEYGKSIDRALKRAKKKAGVK